MKKIKATLEAYTDVRIKMQSLKALEDDYKRVILDFMAKEDAKKIDSEVGTFTRVERKTKKITSDKVKVKEAELKAEKEKAIEKGEFEEIISESLLFKN